MDVNCCDAECRMCAISVSERCWALADRMILHMCKVS